MSKRLIYFAFILFLASASHGEPKLVATAPFFDFGSLPGDAVLIHHFWLKSVGGDTVVISDIKTGCSCALVEETAEFIPPNDSVEIGIRWDTKRLRGSISRAPRIYYNDIETPLRVVMQGTVLLKPDSARPVASLPYIFEFGKIGTNDIDSIEFELHNYSDQDVTLAVLSRQRTEFELSLPASIPAGHSSKGYALLNEEYRDTEFSTSFTLQMNDRRNSTLTIPVKRKIY